MEYVICETDILDPTLAQKIHESLIKNTHNLDKDKSYDLIVSFSVAVYNDPSGFENFVLPVVEHVNNRKKNNEKEKIYDVLNFQKKLIEDVFEENKIIIECSTLQGDNLNSEGIVVVELVEIPSENKISKDQGKRKRLRVVGNIFPNKPQTTALASQLYSEGLSEVYCRLLNLIGGDKKIFSEILNIKDTKNNKVLFQAFVKEYGDFWLANEERTTELLERFKTAAIKVLEKHQEEDKEL
ncbi:hypothetical protein [Paenibacillus massiliensis]|uniref:hypothetical protein n=1 Tax=Paenibacillus massiliensis TaxID=225917 RepID=UPI000470B4E4|nr:hypothetical protein [Paenibacillus massiliensis]